MNIELIVVGKTDMKEVEALVAMYSKRLNHYVRFAITTIADVRNTRKLSEAEQKERVDAIVENVDVVVVVARGVLNHRMQRDDSEFCKGVVGGKKDRNDWTVHG